MQQFDLKKSISKKGKGLLIKKDDIFSIAHQNTTID